MPATIKVRTAELVEGFYELMGEFKHEGRKALWMEETLGLVAALRNQMECELVRIRGEKLDAVAPAAAPVHAETAVGEQVAPGSPQTFTGNGNGAVVSTVENRVVGTVALPPSEPQKPAAASESAPVAVVEAPVEMPERLGGWPVKAKVRLERRTQNPKYIIARLYEPPEGQAFRQVMVQRDLRRHQRDGAVAEVKLVSAGDWPVYKMA